jgi:hypothetical protein
MAQFVMVPAGARIACHNHHPLNQVERERPEFSLSGPNPSLRTLRFRFRGGNTESFQTKGWGRGLQLK